MNKYNKFILHIVMMSLMLFLMGCQGVGGEEQPAIITEEDFATIDYVNANSHLGIEFMKSLGNIKITTTPDMGSSYSELAEVDGVIGTGLNVEQLGGPYLVMVEILDRNHDSDIIGVRNGDRYSDAVATLEAQGFFSKNKRAFQDGYNEYFVKGRIAVGFCYEIDEKTDEENSPISDLWVSLYLKRK